MFERVYVVNLLRHPERLKAFLDRLPVSLAPNLKRVGVDGKLAPHAPWWRQGNPAWGCYRSHYKIIEECLEDGVQSCLILEDDAEFCEDFEERLKQVMAEIPSNWGWLYLGGQHLHQKQHPAKIITEHVVRPYNLNRTHAYAINGIQAFREIYRHLNDTKDWHHRNHIDHHYGRMHQRCYGMGQPIHVYAAKPFLIAQAAGRSSISGKTFETRFWNGKKLKNLDPRFVAVIGLHGSGSSAIAGVLHHLGVYMGEELGGAWGKDPDKNCGFEARQLASLCEHAIPFPSIKYNRPRGWIWSRLRTHILKVQQSGLLSGGKYPMLCRMGQQLQNICGEGLRVVHCDRPIEDSIASLQRRFGSHMTDEQIVAHQHWLAIGKVELLASVPKGQQTTIMYQDLLTEPITTVNQLVLFLELTPTQEQTAKAINYIKPRMQHV
jgi:hypothetical protein